MDQQDSKRIKLDCQQADSAANPGPSALSQNEQIRAEIDRRLQEKRDTESLQLQHYLDQKLAGSRYKSFTYHEHMKRPRQNSMAPTNEEKILRRNELVRIRRFQKNKDDFCVQQKAVFAKNVLAKLKDDIGEADRKIEELEEMMRNIGASSMLEGMKEPYDNVEVTKNVTQEKTSELEILDISKYEDFEEDLRDRCQSTNRISEEDLSLTKHGRQEVRGNPLLNARKENGDITMTGSSIITEDEDYFSYDENPLDLRVDWKKYGHEFDT